MMKKVLSLVLALGTVLSCLGTIGVSATDATAATLIYDMDLSAYATEGQIKNAVEGSNLNFALTNGTLGTETAAEYISADKQRMPYIATRGSNSKLQLSITDSDMLAQSYTFEAWIQKKTAKTLNGVRFMEFLSNGTEANGSSSNAHLTLRTNGNTGSVNSSGETNTTIYWNQNSTFISKNYDDDAWMKITMVRKMEKDSETNQYTVTKNLYINGLGYHDRNNAKYATDVSTLDSTYEETSILFSLGCVSALEEFDIADVKLYQGVRTADEIKTDYDNEKSLFTALDESDLLVYDMDLTEFSADAATIANSVEEGATLNVAKVSSGTYGKASFINAAGEQIPYINMENNNTVFSYEDASLAGKTLTLEAWVNRRSSKAQNTLFRIFGTNADGETVNEAKLTNGAVTFEDYPYASPWRVPNSTTDWFYSYSPATPTHIKQDTWIHIAIVRDMSVEGKVTETYYFNGAVGKTWSYDTTATEAKAAFSVQGGGEPQFNVADVKVYADLAFTDSEIKAHYNAEKAAYAQANALVSAQNSAYRLRDSNDKGVMSSSGSKDYGQTFYFETGINSPTDGVVLVAIYEDGRLEAVKSVQVTAETASPLKVEFTNGITYDANAKYEIKAFTWDGMTALQPYGQAKSYQFK